MGTYTEILQAGVDRLAAMPDIGPELISWQATNASDGKAFEPPSSSDEPHLDCWYEFSWLPNETGSVFWGNDAQQIYEGLLQVMVGFRPGWGLFRPLEQAELIKEWFKKGTPIGPIQVRKHPWISLPPIESGAESFIPVTIPYYGLAK